jgi:hypothetical protein
MSNSSSQGTSGTSWISNIAYYSSLPANAMSTAIFPNGTIGTWTNHGYLGNSAAINAIQLSCSTGNIANGIFSLYGIF